MVRNETSKNAPGLKGDVRRTIDKVGYVEQLTDDELSLVAGGLHEQFEQTGGYLVVRSRPVIGQ